MKFAHNIKLSVFSYSNEDSDKILKASIDFFPFDLEKSKIAVKKSSAEGFNDRKTIIYQIIISKTTLINQFLYKLLERIDKIQKDAILEQSESRLDQELDFFIRFDKDSWVNERKLILTDSGRCFHLKISIAAFPKKREVALNIVKELFK
ncbi:hypothetical protein HYS31_01195 [Candidatus Woesearchaeota archaeon]|nr:hypothetical protein [Candidatus Woesearchaeota archaeon]